MNLIRLYHPNDLEAIRNDIVRLYFKVTSYQTENDGPKRMIPDHIERRDVLSIDTTIREHLNQHLGHAKDLRFERQIETAFGRIKIEHIPSNVTNCPEYADGGVIIVNFSVISHPQLISVAVTNADMFVSDNEARCYYKYYYNSGEALCEKIVKQLTTMCTDKQLSTKRIATTAEVLFPGSICKIDRIKTDGRAFNECYYDDFAIFLREVMMDDITYITLVEISYSQLIHN